MPSRRHGLSGRNIRAVGVEVNRWDSTSRQLLVEWEITAGVSTGGFGGRFGGCGTERSAGGANKERTRDTHSCHAVRPWTPATTIGERTPTCGPRSGRWRRNWRQRRPPLRGEGRMVSRRSGQRRPTRHPPSQVGVPQSAPRVVSERTRRHVDARTAHGHEATRPVGVPTAIAPGSPGGGLGDRCATSPW